MSRETLDELERDGDLLLSGRVAAIPTSWHRPGCGWGTGEDLFGRLPIVEYPGPNGERAFACVCGARAVHRDGGHGDDPRDVVVAAVLEDTADEALARVRAALAVVEQRRDLVPPRPDTPAATHRPGPSYLASRQMIDAKRRELLEAGQPAGERSIARELGVSRDAVRSGLGKTRRRG